MRDNGTGSLFDLHALRSRGKTLQSRGQITITWSIKTITLFVCIIKPNGKLLRTVQDGILSNIWMNLSYLRSFCVFESKFICAGSDLLLNPCLPTSANGPLLGHLFGFKYFDFNLFDVHDKNILSKDKSLLFKNPLSLLTFMYCSMLQSQIPKGTVSLKIFNVTKVISRFFMT